MTKEKDYKKRNKIQQNTEYQDGKFPIVDWISKILFTTFIEQNNSIHIPSFSRFRRSRTHIFYVDIM